MIKKEAKNHPFRGKEKILLLNILKKKKISKQQKDEEHFNIIKAELREEKKSERNKNGKKQKISNKNIK